MSMGDYLNLSTFCQETARAWRSNHLYCLVDHAGMPGLHRELVRAGVPWTSLFAASREEAVLQAAPLLFSLDTHARRTHAQLLTWLAQRGTYTSSLLMLSSPLELEELGSRLARRMQARISENMDVLLRFFDPRVFEALMASLDKQQQDAFVGVADSWWYVDRCGNVVAQPARYDAGDIFNSPLILSASQEFALVDASEVDQIAAQLEATMPDAYNIMGAPQRYAFLQRQMESAMGDGIVGTYEVSLYCGLALLYGEDFSATTAWQNTFTKVRAGGRLSDLVAEENA
jgi:hypothetical protein